VKDLSNKLRLPKIKMNVKNIIVEYSSNRYTLPTLAVSITGLQLKAIIKNKFNFDANLLFINNSKIEDNETLGSKDISENDVIVCSTSNEIPPIKPIPKPTVNEKINKQEGLLYQITNTSKVKYLAIVAIDFGTRQTGFAYIYMNDSKKEPQIKEWCVGGVSGRKKTLTDVLFDDKGKFHSFGYTAREHYFRLKSTEIGGWQFFQNFKMALFDKNVTYNRDFVALVPAANGTTRPVLDIFSESLKFLKKTAMDELNFKSRTGVKESEVKWLLTVPAIWKPKAKQIMQEAAALAGLDIDLVLEPEAGALSCIETLKKSSGWTFNGIKYILVDLGGGTVDCTCHEVNSLREIKELHPATGGDWGSAAVDQAFINLLSEIFDEDVIKEFKTCGKLYIDLLEKFEQTKHLTNPEQPTNRAIEFNSKIHTFFTERLQSKGSSIESRIEKYNINYKAKHQITEDPIEYLDNNLLLSHQIMNELFNFVIDPTIKHTKVLLTKVPDANYIFLVGGFSESPMIQAAFKKNFSIPIITPPQPIKCILEGAVFYGLNPEIISVRRARKTYGIETSKKFDDKLHLESDRYTVENIEYGKQLDVFVRVNEEVRSSGNIKILA
jgi:molecular chaperone DnaK (HSP70)